MSAGSQCGAYALSLSATASCGMASIVFIGRKPAAPAFAFSSRLRTRRSLDASSSGLTQRSSTRPTMTRAQSSSVVARASNIGPGVEPPDTISDAVPFSSNAFVSPPAINCVTKRVASSRLSNIMNSCANPLMIPPTMPDCRGPSSWQQRVGHPNRLCRLRGDHQIFPRLR